MSDLLVFGLGAPTFLTLGLGETYGRRDAQIEDFRVEPPTVFVNKPSGIAIEELEGTMVEFEDETGGS